MVVVTHILATLQGPGDFAWTVKEQGIILGTFFWGYFFTKTIGKLSDAWRQSVG